MTTEAGAVDPRLQNIQMVVGAGTLAALSAAANMGSPLYPALQAMHGMSNATMNMLYATYAIAAIPSLLLFGSVADALGRRTSLILAVVVSIGGTAIFAIPGAGVPGLFVGRALLGAGLGLGTGAGAALVTEASPPRRPALGATIATISFGVGTGAGPLLAGTVSTAAGGALRLPFGIMLAILVLVMAAVCTYKHTLPTVRTRWRPTKPSVPMSMRQTFAVSAVSGFLGWCALGVFLALLPAMSESLLGTDSPAAVGVIVATVLLVSAVAQIAAPMFVPRAAQSIGLTLIASGMVLLVATNLQLLDSGFNVVLVVAAAILTGCGHGLSYWGANQETDACTPTANRASVMAALYVAFYAGAGIPAVLVGALSQTMAMNAAIALVSVALVMATVVFLPAPGMLQTAVRSKSRANTHSGKRVSQEMAGSSGSGATL